MITPSDLLRLPYTPDLTEGGIAYALRSLANAYERAGRSPYDRLRHQIAGAAVELAFRRHLSQNDIPFEVKAASPFADPDRYDVFLDGRRCDIKSFFISHRGQIAQIRREPSALMSAPALVPSDHHARDGHSYTDLYIFAFLTGLTAVSQADLRKAIEAKQPHYLVHAMPEKWRRPAAWNPLGRLALKSESDEELLIEITGQGEAREMKRTVISLPPKTKITSDESFHSITSLHVRRAPEARIGVRCEAIREIHVVPPLAWANLWVYGMDVFLAGFISYEEFGQRAHTVLPNSRVFQYERTRVKNLGVPLASLKPIRRLFE